MMLTPSLPFVKERQARQGRGQGVAAAEYYYLQGLCNTHCMVFFHARAIELGTRA